MLILTISIFSCQNKQENKNFTESEIAIIPKPAKLELENGAFQFDKNNKFVISDVSQKEVFSVLIDKFKNVSS